MQLKLDIVLYLATLGILNTIVSGKSTKQPVCRWKFKPNVKNNKFGRLYVLINNLRKEAVELDVLFDCPTLIIRNEPKRPITIPGGKKGTIVFPLSLRTKNATAGRNQAKNMTIKNHQCVLLRWNKKASQSVHRCKITISAYPENGGFLPNCKKFVGTKLTISSKKGSRDSKVVVFSHKGPPVPYTTNVRCSPSLPELEHKDLYREVNDNDKWDLVFPRPCMDILDVNYAGFCSIRVVKTCQGKKFAADYNMSYFDGKVDECVRRGKTGFFKLLMAALYLDVGTRVLFVLSLLIFLASVIATLVKCTFAKEPHIICKDLEACLVKDRETLPAGSTKKMRVKSLWVYRTPVDARNTTFL